MKKYMKTENEQKWKNAKWIKRKNGTVGRNQLPERWTSKLFIEKKRTYKIKESRKEK